jgi:hypothetical protein
MLRRITFGGALVLGAVLSCSNDDDKDAQSAQGGRPGGGAAGAGAANAGGTQSGGAGGQTRGGTKNDTGGAAPMAGISGAPVVPSGGLGGEPGSEDGGSGGEDEGATGGNAGPGGSSAGGNSNGGSATGGVVATSGAGGAGEMDELCGGIVCETGLVCCGPAECGFCINPDTSPACATSCPRRPCGDDGLECLNENVIYPGELCVEAEFTVGPSAERSWECRRNPCTGSDLDCDCAGDLCAELDARTDCVGPSTDGNTLRCAGGGPCNSPDTPIATPDGERAIASLEPGDLVYSMHRDSLSAVPLQRVARTAVHRHEVVRVTLESGAVLEISAGHPTADGRTFRELDAGTTLDGVSIVAREVIPYRHPYTYDILPNSDTGTYVAGGVLIGSTLATSSLPARCGMP